MASNSSNSSAAPKPLPAHWNLFAGAIAGVSEILAMYPLDVVKTRFQLQVGKSSADSYTSIVDCFQKIIKKEGPGVLYRGIAAPIMVEAPKRAIKFSANEQYRTLFKSWGLPESRLTSVLTGVSAGITEAFVVVSFDLVKIRLQDKANAGKYKNTSDAFAKIFQQEGFIGFFRGLEATIWRHGVWNGGYFGCISTIRQLLPKAETKQGTLANNFIAGTIGGTIGTILNTPFDVAKTRIQNQTLPFSSCKYNWTLPAVATIAKEEGFGALYKGFVPKVLRLGPGGGILLVVFEALSGYIRKNIL
ncbi:mitochondrial carrier domain-containing protein [Polychytrium aggregatum]|uniref:mitochondrial carrier domain-containing protein n=1 Tax=Polychytrium aggregatum TaxID=110093 RepID=UPI0022FE66FF|nr:mitochondrial carrier domain-containing protein [Polychytrium aggregatum]KAI9209839.1 mitochondrial carrier domain-containing protein [Polychytrium aggregatum]